MEEHDATGSEAPDHQRAGGRGGDRRASPPHGPPHGPSPGSWASVARRARIAPDERLLVALSGGRDSVALFLLAATAPERPHLRAVHVDHGWRGAAGEREARAVRELAHAHGVPVAVVRLDLDARAPSAEARARAARYRAIVAEARGSGHTTVLTAHHADDVLEGLLLRWRRSGAPSGALAPDQRLVVRGLAPGEPEPAGAGLAPVSIVRPLADWSRPRLDALLAEARATWCEDPSNRDPRHARNALRRTLLPLLDARARAALHRLGAAHAALDASLEPLVPAARPLAFAALSRGPANAHLGAACDARAVGQLPPGIAQHALARFVVRATGAAPTAAALDHVVDALHSGHTRTMGLGGGYDARLVGGRLELLPHAHLLGPGPARVPWTGAPIAFADGRRVDPALVVARLGAGAERAAALRGARAGDRWQSGPRRPERALARALAECGVPPSERGRVLVVVDEDDRVLAPLAHLEV